MGFQNISEVCHRKLNGRNGINFPGSTCLKRFPKKLKKLGYNLLPENLKKIEARFMIPY